MATKGNLFSLIAFLEDHLYDLNCLAAEVLNVPEDEEYVLDDDEFNALCSSDEELTDKQSRLLDEIVNSLNSPE